MGLAKTKTNDWSQFRWPLEELRRDLIEKRGAANGGAAYQRVLLSMKNVALQWLYAVKSYLKGECAEGPVCYQLIGFDLAVSANLDVKLLDSNTGAGMSLKPEWLWQQNSAMATQMANIISTVVIARNLSTTITWPQFDEWERIYDSSDVSSSFASEHPGLLQDGECYSASSSR